MTFYSINYEYDRQATVIWLVNYKECCREARFDRVLIIKDGEASVLGVEELLKSLTDTEDFIFDNICIGPFNNVCPCTPATTKKVIEIAQAMAKSIGKFEGLMEHDRI